MQIPASHGHLEANLRPAESEWRGLAVMCHPHPQHGGTMHTKAVFRTAQALAEVGFDVLRFNFRGVGTSTGSYGGGTGEEEDVRDAVAWLLAERGDGPLLLGGFSFGARVALTVGVEDDRVTGLLGLGLPFSMYDFSFLTSVSKPLLLVQGGEDEFGGTSVAEEAVSGWDTTVTLRTVDGSDHYFHDHFDELQGIERDYFTSGPGASAFPEQAGVGRSTGS